MDDTAVAFTAHIGAQPPDRAFGAVERAMHSELEVAKFVWSVSQAQESRWGRLTWKPRGVLKIQEVAHA